MLVVDTNIFVQHELHFNEIDWMRELESGHTVSLLIPMTAIRELDKLKRAPNTWKINDSTVTVKSRARTTLRWIRDEFRDPMAVVSLTRDVTIELLLDPLGTDASTTLTLRSLIEPWPYRPVPGMLSASLPKTRTCSSTPP